MQVETKCNSQQASKRSFNAYEEFTVKENLKLGASDTVISKSLGYTNV